MKIGGILGLMGATLGLVALGVYLKKKADGKTIGGSESENNPTVTPGQACINAINAIGTVVYPTSNEAITNAETLYGALSANDKNIVIAIYPKLAAARRAYTQLKSVAGIAELKQEAQLIDTLITSIGNVEYPDSEAALLNAENMYKNATKEKGYVTKSGTLKTARDKFEALKSALAAVTACINRIKMIAEATGADVIWNITKAEGLYAALPAIEKTKVTNYNILTTARSNYDVAQADINKTKQVQAIADYVIANNQFNSIENAQILFDSLLSGHNVPTTFPSKTQLKTALKNGFEGNYSGGFAYYNGKVVKRMTPKEVYDNILMVHSENGIATINFKGGINNPNFEPYSELAIHTMKAHGYWFGLIVQNPFYKRISGGYSDLLVLPFDLNKSGSSQIDPATNATILLSQVAGKAPYENSYDIGLDGDTFYSNKKGENIY